MFSKYFKFFKTRSVSGKTFVIYVYSQNEEYLGKISWRTQWRRYVFLPGDSSLYDSACLKELCKYIDDLMLARKTTKRKEPK